jgi:hypothetical protein
MAVVGEFGQVLSGGRPVNFFNLGHDLIRLSGHMRGTSVQRDGGEGRQARLVVGRALQRGRQADQGVGQPQEHAAQGRIDDARPPEDWRCEPRGTDTHASSTDDELRLYRKSIAAPALPS